jgi:hypothetical protein
MMASTRISSPPPPRPWIARAAIRAGMLAASPPITDPTRKIAIAATKTVRRPSRSPSTPWTDIATVPVRT